MTHAALRRAELAATELLGRQSFESLYDLADMDVRRFSLPVEVRFDSFTGFCETTGLAREELSRRGAAEGLSLRHEGMYLVLYDELAAPRRLNFTLAHELGHILLGHIGEEGTHLECEADAFAAALLCPAVAVRYLEHQVGRSLSAEELYATFPISREAARRRVSELAAAPSAPPSDSEITLLLNLFGRFVPKNAAPE